MHIFSGPKMYQKALDAYRGNGFFTYFVLNGLKGKAGQNNNKKVTVLEMSPHLSDAVKEASGGS